MKTDTSLNERGAIALSGLALGWTALLGLSWLGKTSAWLHAPEMSLPLFAGLLLVAVTRLLSPRQANLARIASLTALSAAMLLLLRELSVIGWEHLLGNAELDGTSALGRLVLSGWLLAACVAGLSLGSARTVMLAIGLVAAAIAAITVTAVGVFMLSCWLMFGELPGSGVLMSPSLSLTTLLLSLALVLAGWHAVERHDARMPDEAYRWIFARKLALLLTTCFIAGLSAAALTGAQAMDLLTDGLENRAERFSRVLELFVERNAALVHSLHFARSKDEAQALTLALRETSDEFRLSSERPVPIEAGWPVLRGTDYRAELLADARILLQFNRDSIPQYVLLKPRQLPAALSETASADATALNSRPLLCRPTADSRLECAEIRAPYRSSDRAEAQLHRLSLAAPSHGHLMQLANGHVGTMLGQPASLGTEGNLLLIKIDAATVFKALGAPLLTATGLLALLALAATLWSCWRQLPKLRSLHRARAQGEATMSQMPLAVLVMDENLQIVQLNAAAARLLQREEAELLNSPAEQFFVGGLPTIHAGAQVQRCVLRDSLGNQVPIELSQARFQVAGRQLLQLLLRDLRVELQGASELLRWRHVFEESGWGMALGSVGGETSVELCNNAYARMLGYEPAELVGRPLRQMVAPALWDRLLAMRTEVDAGGTVQGHLRHCHRDGHEIPTLVSISGLRDAEGRLTHYLASVQDISALKLAEEEATRNATHLRAVLDALPVGVWIGDTQGQVLQTNRAARRLWPTGADGIPKGRDHESLMRRAAITRAELSGSLVEQAQFDGGIRSLLTIASPIIDRDRDMVVGAIAIDEDLSAQRRSEQALRTAHELLERILQSCAIGIALTDSEGQLLRHNPAWTLMLGTGPRDNLLEQLLEPDDTLRQRALLQRVASGELPTYVGEHRVCRANGQHGWALLVVSRLDGHSDQAARVLVQLMDVDERRRAGEEIAASNLRLAVAQKLARVGDWQWLVTEGRINCSEQMLALLGHVKTPLGRLSRDQLLALVRPEDRERLSGAMDRALLNMGRLSEDVQLQRGDGLPLIVHLQGVTQRTPDGLTMAGTIQDVTERKAIEEELRQSRERLRELMAYEGQIIEDERKRIAREVHDELGQLLTALRMDLSLLRGELPGGSGAIERATRMRETMGTMTEVVRHVAANLRPAALDLGLTAAIEWLAEDFSLRWETHVELQLPRDEPRLSETAAVALFRAVQESLTNIAKHAGATEVAIFMGQTEGELLLRIGDNGRGFDPVEVATRRRGGLGLLGMRERMHAIGARLDVHSGNGGTTVEIRYAVDTRSGHNPAP